MPQLHPWGKGQRKGSRGSPTGGLLDPATHPASASSRRLQPVNGVNVVNGLHRALLQADTAMRSAANVLTLGAADNAEAALGVVTHGGIKGSRNRYYAALSQQRGRDAYDTHHRRTAQLVGDAAGIGLSLYAAPLKGGAVAVRLPGAVGLTGRDAAAILTAGAATGVVGQRVTDLATGQKSSWQNEAGAGIGGVAGAGAIWMGPQRAGAIDGAVTSAAQDLLNHRPVSLENAAQSAVAGRVLGHVAGNKGEQWSRNLSPKSKGRLGESLGDLRSTVNGLRREGGAKVGEKIGDTRKWWFPDGRSGNVRFEDKFGEKASLSKNQKMARDALGRNFWLNHFLPEDIGKAASVPAMSLSTHHRSPDLSSRGA
jgi:hypothetical protein